MRLSDIPNQILSQYVMLTSSLLNMCCDYSHADIQWGVPLCQQSTANTVALIGNVILSKVSYN